MVKFVDFAGTTATTKRADAPVQKDTVGHGGLTEEFGAPPFSVLDARSGWWQERKTWWLVKGIKSEVGRGANLLSYSDTVLEPDPKKRAEKKRKGNRAKAVHDNIAGGGSKLGQMYKDRTKAIGSDSWVSAKKQDGAGLHGRRLDRKITPGGGGGGGWKNKTADGSYKTAAEIGTDDPAYTGTSIFDPVLCELFYKWFVPKGGAILDPFSGGSVRGLVASMLGFKYAGVDLRKEQVEANCAQYDILQREGVSEDFWPLWLDGDSREVLPTLDVGSADAIFSCPPFFDLEQYSDDGRDISNMSYDEFLVSYEQIIQSAAYVLKDNRFACYVIGEVRDKKTGICRGLVPETIAQFKRSGFELYNDAILLTAIGSLPIRAGKNFRAGRKLGRTHQYVLIFIKGDPAKAVAAINEAAK